MATLDAQHATARSYLPLEAIQLLCFGFTHRYLNVGVDDISSIIFFYAKSLFNKFHFINPNSRHISITRSEDEDSAFCTFKKLGNGEHKQKTILLQPFISEMFNNTISNQNNNNNNNDNNNKSINKSIASKIKMKLRLLTPSCPFYNSEYEIDDYNRRYCYQTGIIGINKFDPNGKKVDMNKQLEKLSNDIKNNHCIQSLTNLKDIRVVSEWTNELSTASKTNQLRVSKDDIKKYYSNKNSFDMDEFTASFIKEETINNRHFLRMKHNKYNNHTTWCDHSGPIFDKKGCLTLRYDNKDTFVNVTIERSDKDNNCNDILKKNGKNNVDVNDYDYKLYFEKQDINGDAIECQQLFDSRINSIVSLNFDKYEYVFALSTVVCCCHVIDQENVNKSLNSFQFKVSIESE